MNDNNYFTGSDKFKFRCHARLACFNSCCRDISIFLTPYDMWRLKNKLKITSQAFLQQYTQVLETGAQSFPVVMIKMGLDNEKKCPFITGQGCSVYHARPWSCRMAPVDIVGDNQYRFCFDSVYCHGLNESQEWTVSEWADNQEVDLASALEEKFKQIPVNFKFTGLKTLDRHIKNMFLMACYDLDQFKIYIFKSSFLQEFDISPATTVKIKNDDLALMKFGFEWLLNKMDVGKSIKIRDEVKAMKGEK